MALLRATTAVALLAATGLALIATPAQSAEPVCQTRSSTPGQRITSLPWPQQRYQPDRLAAFADGSGVTVAVIDSGVDANHPQLSDNVLRGADFLANGTGRVDCVSHGTPVASIIAARKVDDIKFHGLAPGAKILPIRVTEEREIENGTLTGESAKPAAFADSIDWAVDHGANVINMSLVLDKDNSAVKKAVARAVDADVVVVAAAGNGYEHGNPRPYPAAYPGVLGVGAIVKDGTRLPQSQVGDYVDIMAPGGNVIGDAPGGGQLDNLSGTSFAAPFVSATAALIRQYYPTLKAQDVIRRIKATADPAPGGKDSTSYGAGVLNPYRALTETVATADPVRAQPLPAESVDPAAVAAARHDSQIRRRALWLALGGAAVAAIALLCAVVIPRGVRRHWHPAS